MQHVYVYDFNFLHIKEYERKEKLYIQHSPRLWPAPLLGLTVAECRPPALPADWYLTLQLCFNKSGQDVLELQAHNC